MKKKHAVLWFLLTIVSVVCYAQVEICDDGIDNDSDGFIDCFDKDCSTSTKCDGSYLGNDANCQAKPTAFPKFTMQLDFSSPNETTNHLARMAIGDLDRDGIPEIVTMNRYTKKVFVLNGRTGAVKYSMDAPFTPQWEVAIANIDNDNCAEIFLFGSESGDIYLYSYDCALTTQNWKRRLPGDPINFGVADFNNDGKSEIYAKDVIVNAHTGVRLIKTVNWDDLNGGPVAVDMDGDPALELVVGCIIYDVNLGDGVTADNGSLTEVKRVADYYKRYDYNATSVADFNLDGNLDVIASGSTVAKGANTTVFFWDVTNNVVKTFFDNSAGAYLPNGWSYGTGRLNVADLDGNGQMNVSYVSGKFLYALDENFNLFWRKVINEETSGHTGCTLFDFNGDGKSEIVYRDEQFLYIINGTDGSVFNQQNCISRTNREYPIVADVDADGSTEMCVPCGFDDVASKTNFNDLSYSQYSHVRIFKSAAEPWVPARRLWNQHGYFNVNVKDDLTIPKRMQKHHLVWSVGSCTQGPNRPLNGFLNQSPYLNSQGCPTYASPDITPVVSSLVVTPPQCPNKDFTISFRITNQGDVPLDGSLPLTIYNGDPTKVGAVKLTTLTFAVTGLDPGEEYAVTNAAISGPGGPFTLYISMNDAGTTVPTPIVLPNTNFVECDYANNILSFPVDPLPVAVTAVKISDNFNCVGSTTPNNGAVRAFVPVGATENTTDYTFFWFNGTTVDATPDFTGVTYSGIADGIYTVYATHKTAGCNSDTAQVTVGRNVGPLTVAVTLLAPVTDCQNPNGSLKAVANGGLQPVSNFTFAWYQGNDIFTSPQIGVNDIATGLKGLTYTVLVTDKTTGCQTVESLNVPNNTSQPVVAATKVDITCSSATSGQVSATADGVTAGYKFEWSRGSVPKPTPDFTTAAVTGLTAGSYTVVTTNNASKCASTPLTVTITQTNATTVTATKLSDQTSCDPTKPNGAGSSSVVGGPAGFTFEWFVGQNTLAVNKIASTAAISGLDVGTYTVKATNNTTGCFDTGEITINFAVVVPTLSGVVVPVTACNPFNGSITVTPSIDAAADFTFKWYNGASVKATTDFPDTDNVLSNLTPGVYTVEATHNTKNCIANAITMTVVDNSPAITITQNLLLQQIPTDCSSANGIMHIDVTPAAPPGNYKIEWFGGRAPFPAPAFQTDNGAVGSTAPNLKTGIYTVFATDVASGCGKNNEFYLPYANAHGLNFVSKDDVEKCVPGNDGAGTVQLVKTPDNPPAIFVESDYDIIVYNGTNDPGTGSGIETITGVNAQLNYTSTIPLIPGPYVFVAVSRHPATLGCRSQPVLMNIVKTAVDPVLTLTSSAPNTNCTGSPGTGQLTVSADGNPPAGYTFEWFAGATATPPILPGAGANGEMLPTLTSGLYTVKATNNGVTSTGCFSTKTFTVFNNPMQVSIGPAGMTEVELESCDPTTGTVLGNGSATITSVTQNGAGGNMADYTFDWTNVAGTVLQTGASPALTNLAAGTYFVKAQNSLSSCFGKLEFEIIDNTKGTTLVNLVSFENAERCIAPKNGRLTVSAGPSVPADYNFEWFAGTTPSGPVVGNTNDLQNINVQATGQPTATMTIKVINTVNSCWAVDSYILPLLVNPVQATVSSAPLTNCISNDGSVFGTVTNDNSLDYTYNWSIGNTPKATPDFTGKLINGLAAGPYTLVAIDNIDSFCAAAPLTSTVIDARIIPAVIALQSAPVTNCDPAKANGGANASANSDVISYVFDWFMGATVTATPFFTGPEANSLAAGQYTVRATHRISGCAAVAQVTVNQNLTPVPNPQITIESQVTSCALPNGVLSADVDGLTNDYIFNWYDGTVVKAVRDYTGERLDSLDVGSYTVTATSRITGCTSGPDTERLILEQIFPDFDFKIIAASCDSDNGFASLIMTSNVAIESIEWNANGSLVEGPNLSDIPSGTYTVTVTSQLGCVTTKDVTIGTDIRPFNGVSRNNDGRNEIFHISCIDNFPLNNVKIFNRAGTMVYEGEGYDNLEIYFDGKSNKGVSPMGVNLPDGTYFYVIDKRDGSKPLAGYLELVK